MIEELIKGFYKFRRKEYEEAGASMPTLVKEGQSPSCFVISCIDSRSNPGTIFHAPPGTFFAHKSMGAIIYPYKQGTALAAALQFALHYNKVKDIIILGHTGCGAIQALVSGLEDPEISRFIDVAKSGLETAQEKCGAACSEKALLRATEEQILLESFENIKTYPSVAGALAEKRVNVRLWLFDMEAGNILEFDAATQEFAPVTKETVHG
ncbi:MAG: hypothetical protein KDJ75_02470 [Alphaproteobacteria bacterium]|nr:hypothetical protein [Alphaproteobacteria bacterium]